MNKSFFLYLIIISMAITPAIALGVGNRNLFLIGVMVISPIIILTAKRFKRTNVWLLLFIFSIIMTPLIHHPESMRWSTVMYTFMFGVTFMAYSQLLYQKSFTVENYEILLKYLIYAYVIVLLMQQFCVLTGLPIFNVSNYYPSEPWKLNSLAPEPSHSARIVALLMYSYITIKELTLNRQYNFRLDIKIDKWVWLAFIWTMITMGSGTAFLFIIIVLLKFIRFKSMIPLLLLVGGLIFIIDMFGIDAFERTYKVFLATLTLDRETIIQTDLSAAIRIVPVIFLAQLVDLTTLDGWLGYGVDSIMTSKMIVLPSLPDGVSGGGLFQLLTEYGFLPFILFIIFSVLNTVKRGDYLSMIFWFMLIFLSSVNSQIMWLAIILLFTNKYFEKKLKKRKYNEKINSDIKCIDRCGLNAI